MVPSPCLILVTATLVYDLVAYPYWESFSNSQLTSNVVQRNSVMPNPNELINQLMTNGKLAASEAQP